jgi:hypothetical protein
MTSDQIDLARRAVASPHWKWLPGMAGQDALGVPFRVALAHHSGGAMVVAGMAFMPAYPDALARMVPDLTDPATAGCLLAVLVAAAPGSGWGVSCGPDVGWRATSCDHDLSGATCGEAVARALLVVWEVTP